MGVGKTHRDTYYNKNDQLDAISDGSYMDMSLGCSISQSILNDIPKQVGCVSLLLIAVHHIFVGLLFNMVVIMIFTSFNCLQNAHVFSNPLISDALVYSK